jgi:hypothetical protein
VTSPHGGVFAVFLDDFNTTSTIDTFSDNNTQLPLCYPVQFPPVFVPPPDLGSHNNHSITLVYTGPSPNAPNRTSSNVQFDLFAIPPRPITNGAGPAIGSGSVSPFLAGLLVAIVYAIVGSSWQV